MDRMTGEFEGPRTAIVTGGARRIGAELCRYLAGAGWHVLIHCLTSRGEAERLAGELPGTVAGALHRLELVAMLDRVVRRH